MIVAELQRRRKGGAPGASTASKSKANFSARQHAEQPYEYKHHSPTFLLVGFAISILVVLGCGMHFLSLRQAATRAREGQAAGREVQQTQARQFQLNTGTRDKWDLYAEQRGNVTKTLMSLALHKKDSSLCVLGAGNMNDMLLSALLPALNGKSDADSEGAPFSSLALVDVDAEAMQLGLERHMVQHGLDRQAQSRIKLYTTDLTNSYATFNAWKATAARQAAFDAPRVQRKSDQTVAAPFPSDEELDAWRRTMYTSPQGLVRMKGLPPSVPASSKGETERFDVVASVCILSQLLDMFMSVVGERHPSFLRNALSVRDAHLALLLDLVKPGGWGVIVTDIVSSSSVPHLRNLTHAQLPGLLPELLETSNFFTGTNPHAILAKLHGEFAAEIVPGTIQLGHPWKWTIGGDQNKQYLVYSIAFQRRPETKTKPAHSRN